MSGPKLSAYELEQIRKAELERIQREIVRLRALAMADIQEVQHGKMWCREETSRLNYQKELVDASSLPQEDKRSAKNEIQSQLNHIKSLEQSYTVIQTAVFGSTLEEVQSEQTLVSAQASECRLKRCAIESGRASYEASLSKVAENLCQQVSTEGYSLEKALSCLPPRPDSGEKLQEQKNELQQRAQAILNNPLATESTKMRVRKALRRIHETDSKRELHEIGSLVIGEIERQLVQVIPLLQEYQELVCTKSALNASLGKPSESASIPDCDVAEIKRMIVKLKSQIEVMESRLLEQAEREEIAQCIDAAMEELGYNFIGKKKAETGSSQIKLFEFNEGTGLQVTHRQDGVIRIKVVGLATENRQPTDREQDLLYREQIEFCDEYDQIIAAFRRRGVKMRTGTQKRNPASRQFSQFVNVTDYNDSYIISEAGSAEKKRRAERRAVRKPKVLSRQ